MLENDFSPKGYVVISDKDGNIIREGHNMVLLNGKKIIASKLSSIFNSLLTTQDKEDFSNYEITKLILSENADETIFNNNYSTDKIADFLLSTINTSINNVENSNGHFSFKISVEYKGESSDNVKTASSICLIATNGTTEKIFSRIRFDSVVLNAESDFNISYYLYF